MPVEIRVPVMGESVVEGTVGKWRKKAGDPVSVGDVLVELETDKVNVEVSSESAGVLQKVLQEEGATVHPGDVIAVVDGAGSPAGAAAPAGTPTEAAPSPNGQDEVRASPLAHRVADDLGVKLESVEPSGPGGRVVRDDVESFARQSRPPAAPPAPVPAPSAAAAPAAAVAPQPAPAPAAQPVPTSQPAPAATPKPTDGARPETRQRLTRRRQTIATRLVEAQHTAALLSTFNEVDLSAVMAIRSRRRDAFKEQHGVGLGYMSFFTRATIGALKAFPQLNAEIQGDELVLKQYYDIGIAIGDPEGLVVPILRDADRMSFAQVEQAIAAFAKKAKERALTIDDLRGGTFTITNGGVFGSLLSTPIVNPPQVGILGMHKIQERPVAVDGQVVIRPMMYLALTYDHRVVDGREAVQFLVRIKELLEDPERLMLEA